MGAIAAEAPVNKFVLHSPKSCCINKRLRSTSNKVKFHS